MQLNPPEDLTLVRARDVGLRDLSGVVVQARSGRRWRIESPRGILHASPLFCFDAVAEDGDGDRRGLLKMLIPNVGLLMGPNGPEQQTDLHNAFMRELKALRSVTEIRSDSVVKFLDEGTFEHTRFELFHFFVVEEHSALAGQLADEDPGPITFENAEKSLRQLHQIANGLRHTHNHEHSHLGLTRQAVFHDGDDAKLGHFFNAIADSASLTPTDLEMIQQSGVALEVMFAEIPPDDPITRRRADLFAIGDLLFYAFTGATVSNRFYAHLGPSRTPQTWPGSFDDLLPALMEAHAACEQTFEFALPTTENDLAHETMVKMFAILTSPEPERRDKITLEQVVSKFDRLSKMYRQFANLNKVG